MATFTSFKSRLIYVFAINDDNHKDCLKIGETTLEEDNGSIPLPNSKILNDAASKRINQYTQTAGIAYQLLHTELTLYIQGGHNCSFNDKQVHLVLERSGIKKKVFDAVKGANEWFCCNLETVKNAIAAVKKGKTSLTAKEISYKPNPIVFRPEQQEAIEKTKKQFRRGKQMLWNAKMRFGKTLCALQVAKDLDMKRTIIVTHRPIVDEGWFEDFGKIFYDRPNYHYGSHEKGESFTSLERLAAGGDKYVYFASMQDMRGSEQVGGKFDKNRKIFSTSWDFLIVDEAHEGTQTELGRAVIDKLSKPQTKILRLSGTPFNLLDDHKEEEIFTWDYVMEQKAKAEWDLTHFGDPNPYASLPAINIYTYDLGRLMTDFSDEEKAFNFREFFRTRENDTFIHDEEVDNFLNLLCRDDVESLYPYSNDTFRKIFRHTLWVLPGVKAAHALSTKLRNHPIFSAFDIVNVAGDGDEEEESRDALQMVNKAIGPDSDSTYTITLSCGRLTTGVSIRPWTAVFMMAGSFSTSAAGYMQTIFRVQTPYTHNGRMKTECYAFDFAPDRTLRVLAETAKVSAKAGQQTNEDRIILGDFLNFCPIISIEGSKMKPYNVDKMMGQLKRAQIEKVVQCGFEDGALYNDELIKLTDVELKDFNELKFVIGKTKAMPRPGDIDINKQGLTNEQYNEKRTLDKKKKSELTPEEQERLEELKALGNQRREAISILRGISIRMPLMLYGAEIIDEDAELTIDNFANLVDDQSWKEFMPKGVDKEMFNRFKKYYDPDIFREAGKRIREMARMADKFTIEQRIERITAIFNTFRNPDKETVLTPWRVVNMHLGDCLGGYCFYDGKWEKLLDIPRYIKQGNVTKNVFHPDSVILEINSKSGLYPLYAAYNVYRTRVEAAKEKYGEIGRAFAMQLWDETLENNILVVCKTPMARSITRRTLAGFRNVTVHARYYQQLIENITQKPDLVVKTLLDGNFWGIKDKKQMKIDAIIGNPPYQVMDGGGAGSAATTIYHKFVEVSITLHPRYISLIIPARWYAGGRGLDEFRNKMLNDIHVEYIKDFPNSKDCFSTANISGGICFFRWNRDCTANKCYFVNYINGKNIALERSLNEHESFVRYNRAIVIINKVKSFQENSLETIVSKYMPFGLRSYERGNITKNKSDDLLLHTSKGKGYISKELVVEGTELINKYNVIVGKAISGHLGETDSNGRVKVLATTKIIGKGEVCTESYLTIGAFNTFTEASNLYKYITSRFARFLLLMGLTSMNITRERFLFVPLQSFDNNSDIDWTKSISLIEDQLYKKYNFTKEDIQFIESMIKPME